MDAGRPIDHRLRAWLHALAVEHGTTAAARRVGLSRSAFACATAGLAVSNGTHAVVRLARLEQESKDVFAGSAA